MKNTIVGVFSSEKQAEIALKEILQSDYANEEISILKKGDALNKSLENRTINELQGYTVYNLDNLGETSILGPLSERFHNNTDHNLTSVLLTYGINKDDANNYENLLNNGKTLLLIETNGLKSSNVVNIMSSFGGKLINKFNPNLEHSIKVFKSP